MKKRGKDVFQNTLADDSGDGENENPAKDEEKGKDVLQNTLADETRENFSETKIDEQTLEA